jgi:hypothetical protein
MDNLNLSKENPALASQDPNAISADVICFEIAYKTKKFPRTPYNLESVAVAAAMEAQDLNGDESVIRIIKMLVDQLDRG